MKQMKQRSLRVLLKISSMCLFDKKLCENITPKSRMESLLRSKIIEVIK